MSVTYYQDEHGGYLGVTDESPKGFKGIVFVGRGPKPSGGPETVFEQGYTVDQLRRLVRVEPWDVPAEWMEAIGYEEPVELHEPEPEPESEEVTIYDIRFPWQVPSEPGGPSTLRDPMFQIAMAIGIVIAYVWWG